MTMSDPVKGASLATTLCSSKFGNLEEVPVEPCLHCLASLPEFTLEEYVQT